MKPMEQSDWYREFYDKSILIGYRGSQAHGTYRPPSEPDSVDDVDICAVTIGPLGQYFGFGGQETFERMEGDRSTGMVWDLVCWDIRHFVNMLSHSNPNAMCMLWLRGNHYVRLAPAGELLIKNRDIFSSKDIYKSFTGYARGQMHKATHGAFNGTMGDKRKKLVEKFGFDTKNMSHTIRLMKMGIEFLSTGQLNVQREDNQYLVDIKKGMYTLDQLKAESERLFQMAELALVNSRLPDKVDRAKAEKLLVDILKTYYGFEVEAGWFKSGLAISGGTERLGRLTSVLSLPMPTGKPRLAWPITTTIDMVIK